MKAGNQNVDIAVFQQEKQGNSCNGDSYFYVEDDSRFICAVVDGLGSGEMAKESSDAAIRTLKENPSLSIEELIVRCNKNLQNKRGVVIGLLIINFYDYSYTLTSIGNVGIVSLTEQGKHKKYIPNFGYLTGINFPYKITKGKLGEGNLFFLYSDGINEDVLLTNLVYNQDIHSVVNTYKEMHDEKDNDDATLIVLKCK